MQYHMVATTLRTVTDTVSLSVEAENYSEALIKAEQVLDIFPSAHDIDGVSYCYIENRENGEVIIVDLREDDSIV